MYQVLHGKYYILQWLECKFLWCRQNNNYRITSLLLDNSLLKNRIADRGFSTKAIFFSQKWKSTCIVSLNSTLRVFGWPRILAWINKGTVPADRRRWHSAVVTISGDVTTEISSKWIMGMDVPSLFIHIDHSMKSPGRGKTWAWGRPIPWDSVADISGSRLLAPTASFVVDSSWAHRVSRSIDGWSSAARSFPSRLCVRIEHPPAGLTRALILHSDESAVQRQVVANWVLEKKKNTDEVISGAKRVIDKIFYEYRIPHVCLFSWLFSLN